MKWVEFPDAFWNSPASVQICEVWATFVDLGSGGWCRPGEAGQLNNSMLLIFAVVLSSLYALGKLKAVHWRLITFNHRLVIRSTREVAICIVNQRLLQFIHV